MITSVSFPVLGEGERCEVTTVNDPVLQGRGRQIEMSDGRHLIVIGHNHGDRTDDFLSLLICLYKNEDRFCKVGNDRVKAPLNKAKIVHLFRKILKNAEDQQRDFEGDVAFLKSTLAQRKNGPPTVIWDEFAPNYHSAFVSQVYPQLRSYLTGVFQKYQIDDLKQFDQMLLRMSQTPDIYLYYSNPADLPNVFVSTPEVKTDEIRRLNEESDRLLKKDIELAQSIHLSQREKKTLQARTGPIIKPLVLQASVLYNENRFQELKEFEVPQVKDQLLKAGVERKIADDLTGYLQAQLDQLKSLALRNYYMSESMIRQPNDQILTVGSLHLEPVMKLLRKACLENRADGSGMATGYGYFDGPVETKK